MIRSSCYSLLENRLDVGAANPTLDLGGLRRRNLGLHWPRGASSNDFPETAPEVLRRFHRHHCAPRSPRFVGTQRRIGEREEFFVELRVAHAFSRIAQSVVRRPISGPILLFMI